MEFVGTYFLIHNVMYLFSTGECFHRCASKCAILTRVSSITSRWTSCPWTPNATGVSTCPSSAKRLETAVYWCLWARSRRYVYHSSQWMVAGNTDHSCISPRLYVHPDSPCAGETWMRQVISFDRVKLTNNEMDDKGHVGNRRPAFSVAMTSWSPSDKTLNAFKKVPVALATILNQYLRTI